MARKGTRKSKKDVKVKEEALQTGREAPVSQAEEKPVKEGEESVEQDETDDEILEFLPDDVPEDALLRFIVYMDSRLRRDGGLPGVRMRGIRRPSAAFRRERRRSLRRLSRIWRR